MYCNLVSQFRVHKATEAIYVLYRYVIKQRERKAMQKTVPVPVPSCKDDCIPLAEEVVVSTAHSRRR